EDGIPGPTSQYFGVNTLGVRQLRDKLPRDVFASLAASIRHGKKLDLAIAPVVAQVIKEWAIARGVTHFTHWFQPQTGLTAEKHDAFFAFDDDRQPMESFTGDQLIQSEPDASSFPSGGLRSTWEARGYTAWNPASPVFIMESTGARTLCIPSVFIGYNGEALDEMTPLLRSSDVLSQKSIALLELIGDKGVQRVFTTLGPEQEYFLIDRAHFGMRPDLVMGGRTLIGAPPPRGQQLEDHYFAGIPERVQGCIAEAEFELYKLGVPITTRHNEVAPCQFEMAPYFEETDLGVDHNQLVMATLRRVALRHGLQALLHEKPFAGINGSGKHCNWSMSVISDSSELDGLNLLKPGKTPHQNIRFLVFLAAVLRGVHKHSGLLRAGIATSGNEHRLGANEAPPAIISVFMGDMLTKVIKEIAAVRFEGNNYSEDWVTEAKKRGLPNLRRTPEALKELVSKQSRSVLTKLGVFSKEELESRYHVRVERYVKDMLIELHTMREMVDTMVIPAAYSYLSQLSDAASQAKAAGIAVIPQIITANQIGELVQELQEHREDLSDVIARV